MAEIHVEPPRRGGLGWLWALLALLIIAGLVWYFVLGAPGLGRPTTDTTRHDTTTGATHVAPAHVASLGASRTAA